MEANRLAHAPASHTLTLTRPWDGIGDWLFALAVLKFVNRQRPDVALHVDFSARRARAGLPPLVRQLYDQSDVAFTPTPGPPGGMVTADSLVYRAYPPANYIESTVLHLNAQTGLGIRYEPGVYPVFRAAATVAQRGDYVVMVSQGKRRDRFRKEWGYANFHALALRLSRLGVPVVQLGKPSDAHLTGVRHRVLGAHAGDVVRLLSGARAFVGIENGLMVLAGYLGVPQVTIYDGAPNVDRTNFAGQAKIAARIEPPEAAAVISKWLQTGSL